MTTLDSPGQAGQREGEARKRAVHDRPEVHRHTYVRNARQDLLARLLTTDIATADDVVESVGLVQVGIGSPFRDAVPRHLAQRNISRRVGYVPSARPSRHASTLGVGELADRAAAMAWLACRAEWHGPDSGEVSFSLPGLPAPQHLKWHQPNPK